MGHPRSVFVLGNHVQACCWQVERLPRAGETFQATGLTVEPGGKGLNVAVGLRRLGLDVRVMIGCGQDGAADELLKVLAQEGLNTGHVIRFAGASGWGAGLIGANGQNAIAVYPGANLLLTPQHVQAARADIENAHLVYGQFETSVSAVTEAFAIAHGCGIPTVLNPSPWQTPNEALRRSTHTVLVNETEAQALLGIELAGSNDWTQMQAEVASHLPAFWLAWPSAQQLVITLGEQGVAMYWRHPVQPEGFSAIHMPAAHIAAIDTVGAGDAFAAGFVVCWLQLLEAKMGELQLWQEALRQGQVCGAHMAATRGVLAALPGAQHLPELVARHAIGAAKALC